MGLVVVVLPDLYWRTRARKNSAGRKPNVGPCPKVWPKDQKRKSSAKDERRRGSAFVWSGCCATSNMIFLVRNV